LAIILSCLDKIGLTRKRSYIFSNQSLKYQVILIAILLINIFNILKLIKALIDLINKKIVLEFNPAQAILGV